MEKASSQKHRVINAPPRGAPIVPDREYWYQHKDRRHFQLLDPRTEKPSGSFPMANAQEINEALVRSEQASQALRAGQITYEVKPTLAKLSSLLHARRDDFAQLMSEEMGAPYPFARTKQMDSAMEHIDAFLLALEEESIHGTPDVRFQPYGVALLITPWNWPISQVVLKLGAALAAGCAIVLKPSELVPQTSMLLASVVHEAGVPAPLFQLVLGDKSVGEALVRSPLVDVISFTGSTFAGRKIAAIAGENLTPVTLELGGKSANILHEDCDLALAVKQGVAHCFRNTGQACNAASRMIVHEAIYEEVIKLAKQEAESFVWDDPSNSSYNLGVLASSRQFERAQSLLASLSLEDGRLVTGGPGRPETRSSGYYMKPTVYRDVPSHSKLFQTEMFAPVLTITPYKTLEEAVELANATPYCLSAYIQTADLNLAHRLADQLNAGMVQVNGTSRKAGAPFGGIKASGFGREAGIHGIRAFQYLQSVSIPGAIR